MAKRQKRAETPRAYWELDDEDRLAQFGSGLPRDPQAIISEVAVLLKMGDGAVRERRVADAQFIYRRIDCCVLRMNGDAHFGSFAARDRITKAVRAPLGQVPLWGQPGQFVATFFDGMFRAAVEFDSVGEISFDLHAIDFDRPFISESGYRAFAAGKGFTDLHETVNASDGDDVANIWGHSIAEYVQREVVESTHHDWTGKKRVDKAGAWLPPKMHEIEEKYRSDSQVWRRKLRKLAGDPPPPFVPVGHQGKLMP